MSTTGFGARGETRASAIRQGFSVRPQSYDRRTWRRPRLAGLCRRARGKAVGDAIGADWLVPLMADLETGVALLLDVGDFTVGAGFPVPSRNTPAGHRREPQQANHTHGILAPLALQTTCPGSQMK